MITIYGIKCNITNMLYIGSTKQKLNKRLSTHKWSATNRKCPCASHKIINNNDYIIYEIEKCDENMRDIREQYWLDNTDNINIKNPISKGVKNMKSYGKRYKSKEKIKIYKQNLYKYQCSWGGRPQSNNNLLFIDIDLFTHL